MKRTRTIACTTLALALLTACAEEKSNVRDYNAERAAGASSAPAAPTDAPAAPEAPAAPAENAAGDIARFNAVPTSGDDPAWCGPTISYLQLATEKGNALGTQQADSPEAVAAGLDAAKDATDAASIPGLPEDLKKMFTDLARLNTRGAETKGELTDADNELGTSVLEDYMSLGETLPQKCPATVAAAEEASAE